MRHNAAFLSVLAAAVLAVGPSNAQAQTQRAHFSLGGGFTVPNSEVKDRFGNGYNFNIGMDFTVTPNIYIEGLYSFNGLGEKRISIPLSPTPYATTTPTDFFSSMNMQYGTANVIFQKAEGAVRPYGLVGMGVYLSAGQDQNAWRRLRARVLRPVVVLLRSRRLGAGREHRRRAELHRLRHGFRRRPAVRGDLRRNQVSLHLGSDYRSGPCSQPVDDPGGYLLTRGQKGQRSVPRHDVRLPLLVPAGCNPARTHPVGGGLVLPGRVERFTSLAAGFGADNARTRSSSRLVTGGLASRPALSPEPTRGRPSPPSALAHPPGTAIRRGRRSCRQERSVPPGTDRSLMSARTLAPRRHRRPRPQALPRAQSPLFDTRPALPTVRHVDWLDPRRPTCHRGADGR